MIQVLDPADDNIEFITWDSDSASNNILINYPFASGEWGSSKTWIKSQVTITISNERSASITATFTVGIHNCVRKTNSLENDYINADSRLLMPDDLWYVRYDLPNQI